MLTVISPDDAREISVVTAQVIPTLLLALFVLTNSAVPLGQRAREDREAFEELENQVSRRRADLADLERQLNSAPDDGSGERARLLGEFNAARNALPSEEELSSQRSALSRVARDINKSHVVFSLYFLVALAVGFLGEIFAILGVLGSGAGGAGALVQIYAVLIVLLVLASTGWQRVAQGDYGGFISIPWRIELGGLVLIAVGVAIGGLIIAMTISD
jgi:hypothetical protein